MARALGRRVVSRDVSFDRVRVAEIQENIRIDSSFRAPPRAALAKLHAASADCRATPRINAVSWNALDTGGIVEIYCPIYVAMSPRNRTIEINARL